MNKELSKEKNPNLEINIYKYILRENILAYKKMKKKILKQSKKKGSKDISNKGGAASKTF